MQILIRDALPEDAADLLTYVDQISGESDFLTFGPGEFTMTREQESQFLADCLATQDHMYLIAVLDGQIVGSLNFATGKRPRIRHAGEFGVSVSKSHWGEGIGRKLIEAMLERLKDGGRIRKVNLSVRADNERAITLYTDLGFTVEGRQSRCFFIDGVFHDAYWMGLEL